MNDLERRLFAAFESEYRSILEGIRAIATAIEAGEPGAAASVTEAFRLAHTLKGSAHVVGFHVVVTLAHRLESMLARVRDGQLNLGAGEIRLIFNALGAVEDVVRAHGQERQPDVAPVIAALEAVVAGGSPVIAMAPKPESARAEDARRPAQAESEVVRLNAGHLDQLLGTAGALLAVIRGGRDVDADLGDVAKRVDLISREWDLLRRTGAGALQTLARAPEFARVAQFLDMVGEELRPLAKRVRHARDERRRAEWDLLQLGERLRNDTARARLVPAETVLAGFGTMVRDLALELGREVDFRFTGLDAEADRIVLQALKDPLLHLLRNSVDHGIESRDARVARGKDPVGRIHVDLGVAGGRLKLILTDDGRGLDEARVRERAVTEGLITEAEAAALSGNRLSALIFRDGFSTAREITAVSGRGMGMSVVAETISRLRGTIHVASRPGQGLTVTISVPIALANQRVVFVESRGRRFAIPGAMVDGLERRRRQDVGTVNGRPSIDVDQVATPFASLGTAVGLDGEDATGDARPVVVLAHAGRRAAFAVDRVCDEREVLTKALGPCFRRQPAFSGAIIEPDGGVALVLDAATLVNGAFDVASSASPPAPKTAPTKAVRGPLRILVVDDSITTRTLEKGILESNGHHVSLAVDGLDALQKLQSDHFDLVISDAEMPRLDGFGLVGEIKRHPTLSRIPVIMVTSREHDEDRARGIALGASAYVLKQRFDQGDLLETIRRVT